MTWLVHAGKMAALQRSRCQYCGQRIRGCNMERHVTARHKRYPAPAVPYDDPMRNRRVDLTGLNKQAYREL